MSGKLQTWSHKNALSPFGRKPVPEWAGTLAAAIWDKTGSLASLFPDTLNGLVRRHRQGVPHTRFGKESSARALRVLRTRFAGFMGHQLRFAGLTFQPLALCHQTVERTHGIVAGEIGFRVHIFGG